MSDRRASRFALEVLFLAALAVAVALAELEPILIAAVMLAGWVIVALLEWAVSREQPHYGSGLPPRYYVPQVSMPPRRPLEQVSSYPAARRDEAPTWIAPAELRAEVVGGWPVAPHEDDGARGEAAAADPPAEVRVEEASPAAHDADASAAAELPGADAEPQDAGEPEPAGRLGAAPAGAVPEERDVPAEAGPQAASSAELEPAPAAELEPEQPEPEPEPAPVAGPEPAAEPEPEPAPDAEREPEPAVAAGSAEEPASGAEVDDEHDAPAPTPARAGIFALLRRGPRPPEADDVLPDGIAAAEVAPSADAADSDSGERPATRVIRFRGRRAAQVDAAEPEPADAPVAVGQLAAEHAPAVATAVLASAELGAVGPPTARHRLDPLPEAEQGRWPWQRHGDDGVVVDVPARPSVPRVLPRRLRRS